MLQLCSGTAAGAVAWWSVITRRTTRSVACHHPWHDTSRGPRHAEDRPTCRFLASPTRCLCSPWPKPASHLSRGVHRVLSGCARPPPSPRSVPPLPEAALQTRLRPGVQLCPRAELSPVVKLTRIPNLYVMLNRPHCIITHLDGARLRDGCGTGEGARSGTSQVNPASPAPQDVLVRGGETSARTD